MENRPGTRKLPAKRLAAISQGGGGFPKMAEKWPGKWPDTQKITKFELSGHWPGHFGTAPQVGFPFCSRASQVANLGGFEKARRVVFGYVSDSGGLSGGNSDFWSQTFGLKKSDFWA